MAKVQTRQIKRVAELGQALPETGLIIALVICVAILGLNYMGTNLSDKIQCLADGLAPGAGNGTNLKC